MPLTKEETLREIELLEKEISRLETISDSYKLSLNGSFGKLANKYSNLYSPNLLIQVTVTGQLALLKLIEMLEEQGITVVSANTDGILIKCKKYDEPLVNFLICEWEIMTGFKTEETRYKAVYAKDVNNYLAIKTDGSVKGKGLYANPWEKEGQNIFKFHKNPAAIIVNEAVVSFLRDGKPLETTVRECTDIRKFICVRKVAGGAVVTSTTNYVDDWVPYYGDSWIRQEWIDSGMPIERMAVGGPKPKPVAIYSDAEELGKSIRWYYATDCRNSNIRSNKKTTKGNYNKVPKTEHAKPIMELPDELPTDINYDWYINEAKIVLKDIGYAQPTLF